MKVKKFKFISGKSGFTPTEILVALSIGVLSLTVGFMLLEMGYKYLDHGMTLSAVQRDSRIAMERMFKDLQESKANTVTIGTGAKSISFVSARNVSGVFQFTTSGAPSWQKAVVYYWDSNAKKLYRYEEAKTDWSSNYDPDSAIGNANAQEVIPNVEALQFSTPAGETGSVASTPAPTPTTFTDSTKSWTANYWIGRSIRFTSGILSGTWRDIIANGTNNLTFQSFASPPASGNTYVIPSNLLTIVLTVTKSTRAGKAKEELSTTVKLRN
jgi:hypothetical protein